MTESQQSGFFTNLSIARKITLIIASLGLLFTLSVSIILIQTSQIKETMNRTAHLRIPTVLSSKEVVSQVKGGLAAMRGFLLTANPAMEKQREESWKLIEAEQAKIDSLSKNWTDQRNTDAWAEVKTLLSELKGVQDRLSEGYDLSKISTAPAELAREAVPRANRIMLLLEGNLENPHDNVIARQTVLLEKDSEDTLRRVSLIFLLSFVTVGITVLGIFIAYM